MRDEVRSEFDVEERGLPPAKILAVDDLPANLFALSAMLEPLGHGIVEARSGAEAVALATREEFAVILLDMMMPGMDGFETLARLGEVSTVRHTPVIILTAYDMDPRAIERAHALGAVDYVLKPTAPNVLRSKVAALVSLYRRGRELRNRGAALAAKDRHIAVLAHDLRNPLTVILSAASLLSHGDPAKTQMRADRIHRAAERMNDLIRDLLEYARAGTNAIPIIAERMDLGELCAELVEEFRLSEPDRLIELRTAGHLTGAWDRARLYQALSNLVGNAVRYGEGMIEINACRTEARVEVMVHNKGPTVSPELLPIIFEPFERGDQDRRGLGLGLYIVREIARAHGGEVAVASSSETGTTFTLRLPVAPLQAGDGGLVAATAG